MYEKNIKWAQENNKLSEELLHVQQVAIESKMQNAQIRAENDRLNLKLKHKEKEISKYQAFLKKLKTEPSSKNSKKKQEAIGDYINTHFESSNI